MKKNGVSKSKSLIFIVWILFIFLSSCFNTAKPVKLKNSFLMKIGYDINDVGNFLQPNGMSAASLFIHYNEGFYYFSDPVNNKIMKVTKSGVPILIIFNKSYNPHIKPTKIDDATSDESLSYVKLYKDYPVYSPGILTTDIDKDIYVVNNDPAYRKSNADQAASSSMILKFDNKGSLLFKLGKEGPDTEPFTSILNMQCDDKDNLVVQEYSITGILIYKFSPQGKLLSKNNITKDQIPLTGKEQNCIVDIIDVKLGFTENDVFITCQYVNKKVENISLVSYEVLYEKILKYSLKSGKFVQSLIKIDPEYYDASKFKQTEIAQRAFGNKKKILKPMESLIGVDRYNNIYMTRPEFKQDNLGRTTQIIYIYDGCHCLKNYFSVDYAAGEEYFSKFFLTPEGKIFSYYFQKGELQFVDIYQ